MEKIIILGHENPDIDSIVSGYLLEKIMTKKGYDSEFIIPDKRIDKDTIDICKRNGLEPEKFMKEINFEDKDIKYILVDHNERELCGKIICIIDHHPRDEESQIDNYYNKKISSTACYICQGNEDILEIEDLRLAILATLVDTASFHSTKGREKDKKWSLNICYKYGLDYSELYKEGLCLTSLEDITEASLNGIKKYNFDGKIVESSYIQIEDPSIELGKIYQIISILKEHIMKDGIDAFVFIVHDMTKFKTMYYLITRNKIKSRYYEMYTSRGNTIMPEVKKTLLKLKYHN